MRLTLKIDSDNEALTVNGEMEIARILRHAADLIESGKAYGGLRDFNGNTVGEFEIEEKPKTVRRVFDSACGRWRNERVEE
jgi:hypothetical protein